MFTSILTSSSPFRLNSYAHKMPQRSLTNRIPTQVTWRDLVPLFQQAILLPWCFVPLVAGGGRISERLQKEERVGAGTCHHGGLPQSSATKRSGVSFQFCSVRKKHCTNSSLMTLCSAGPWPSGHLGTQAAICLGLPSWKEALVTSDIIW